MRHARVNAVLLVFADIGSNDAPEFYQPHVAFNFKVDIWALGLVLIEIICWGRRDHHGYLGSPYEVHTVERAGLQAADPPLNMARISQHYYKVHVIKGLRRFSLSNFRQYLNLPSHKFKCLTKLTDDMLQDAPGDRPRSQEVCTCIRSLDGIDGRI